MNNVEFDLSALINRDLSDYSEWRLAFRMCMYSTIISCLWSNYSNTQFNRYLTHDIWIYCYIFWFNLIVFGNSPVKLHTYFLCPELSSKLFGVSNISLWHLFWRSPISTPFLFISRNAMHTLRWRHCLLFFCK